VRPIAGVRVVDTYELHEPGNNFSKALVDVCYDSHNAVVDVRLRTKSAPNARWSRMWSTIKHTRQRFDDD
jgi:hypothetical protein